jgi:hypothetical protein
MGYTYSVYFRNEKAPRRYMREGYSPLHARSLWLFDQLKTKHHRCWVDNLYMSARFAKAAFSHGNKVLVAGVTRAKGHGIPKCVLQEAVEKQKDLTTTRGTIKAAVLEGDPGCPELVSVSVYDNKPVHFISMICDSIKWVEKTRKVWNNNTRKMEEIKYLRVNINDDYNNKMNAVDIADQLRNHYRPDHWMRQRKWWWSIFLWGLGVLLTNSYLVYCRVMDKSGVKKSQRLTHYEFLHSVAVAWIDREEVDPRQLWRLCLRKRKEMAKALAAAAATTTSPTRPEKRLRSDTNAATASPSPKKSPTHLKAPRINASSLDPNTGALRGHLSKFVSFHCPLESTSKHPSCALHRFILGRKIGSCSQTRGKIVPCSSCKVNLCVPCFKIFHEVEDIVSRKEELAATMEKTTAIADKDED